MNSARVPWQRAWGLFFAAASLVTACAPAGAAGGTPFGAPPTDEETWAIRCIALRGPDQWQRAEKYAAAIRQVAGLNAKLVQVLSDADSTSVFYGRYRRLPDGEKGAARYTPDPQHDLETIRSLQLQGADVWPFLLASLDVLPIHRSAHPEWDLTTIDGYWSLQVAVFYNTGEFRSRRSAAEEYCRLLREQGEEAYYHHGPAQSEVCIGAFPFQAVTEVRRDSPLAGKSTVVTTITDPRMAEVQKRFPFNLQNGHKAYDITRNAETGEVRDRTAIPSFVVVMPKAQKKVEQRGKP